MKPERILLLLDFSDGSTTALRRARQIAKDAGAGLHLLHAIGPRGISSEAAVSAHAQAASEQIEQVVRGLRNRGIEASGRVHSGSVLEAFEQVEDEFRPDLVVVGARGGTRLRRLLLGGTARAVVQHAFAPVLVVRGGLEEEPEPFHAVLVATDFSPDPVIAADAAGGIALPDAPLHVTHVFRSPPQAVAALGVGVVEQQQREVKQQLEQVASELGAVAHFREGDPSRSVARLAEQLGCDLIAIGARGADAISWLGPGSVAGGILQLAGTSVLTARGVRTRPEIDDELEAARAELSRSDQVASEQRGDAIELLRNLRRLVDESRELRHEMLADFRHELDQLAETLRPDHPKLAATLHALERALAGLGI